MADYQIQKELLQEELTFVGYPATGGSGTAVGFSGAQLVIALYSDNQEGAWDFIKYYLLNGNSEEGFPVIQTVFDKKMNEVKKAQYMTEPDGTVTEVPSKVYSDQDIYFEVYAVEGLFPWEEGLPGIYIYL